MKHVKKKFDEKREVRRKHGYGYSSLVSGYVKGKEAGGRYRGGAGGGRRREERSG